MPMVPGRGFDATRAARFASRPFALLSRMTPPSMTAMPALS